MQPVASTSASTVAPLTTPNLRTHTAKEGVAPRRTVQVYLQSIENAQGYFELPSVPVQDSDSPPSRRLANTSPSLRPPVAHEIKRRRTSIEEEEEELNDRDTALVLHGTFPKEREVKGILKKSRGLELKKKPSLVSAMRPRLATKLQDSPTSPLSHDRDAERRGGNKAKIGTETEDKENRRGAAVPNEKLKRGNGTGDTVEESEERGLRKSVNAKGKGKLRSEPETEKEANELEERLEARKERRRNKAFIRKDRAQSASATGVAAASEIKKRVHGSDSDPADSEDGTRKGGRAKKGRKSAERSSRELVQRLERPSAIGSGRLTLKSSAQLGIFNKGKASARIKVGKAVPDLAFSEMRFLNSTRTAAEPDSPRSYTLDDLPNPLPSTSRKSATSSTRRKTYGSKQSLRRRSSTNSKLDSSSSDSPEPEEPAPGRLRSSKGKKVPTSNRHSTPRRQVSSDVLHSPTSPALSTCSRHAPNLPPVALCLDSREPPEGAFEFGAQEESNFSAHSAHSLAMRRRSRYASREEQVKDCRVEAVPEEQSDKLPVGEDPADAPPDIVLSPIKAALETPQVDHLKGAVAQVVVQKEEEGKAGPIACSASSIHTDSIARICADNASTPQPMDRHLQSISSGQQLPSATFPFDPCLGPSHTYHFPPEFGRCRSRSSSIAPSYHRPKSLISRSRSYSDGATYYTGGAYEPNPFSPSNVCFAAGDYNFPIARMSESDGALGDLTSIRDKVGTEMEVENDANEGEEEELMDERFSLPGCQFYHGGFGSAEESRGRESVRDDGGDSSEERFYGTRLDERAVANLWHRNIL